MKHHLKDSNSEQNNDENRKYKIKTKMVILLCHKELGSPCPHGHKLMLNLKRSNISNW